MCYTMKARKKEDKKAGFLSAIGVWHSLVVRLVRDQEAAGSSPVTPTIISEGRKIFLPAL